MVGVVVIVTLCLRSRTLNKLEVDVPCPGCKIKFKQRLEDMKPGRTRICPGCGKTIEFTGDDASGIQKQLDDVARKFGKR